MKNFSLVFTMTLARSSGLILGQLALFEDDRRRNLFSATSGYPGKQYPFSWREKGGVIPPKEAYQVATNPLPMPNVRGVEGAFFAITPFTIQTMGDERGDFGVHADKNAPGSLGCPVLQTDRGWAAFQREMAALTVAGVKSLPLSVIYS
jgi:hypothetical protein